MEECVPTRRDTLASLAVLAMIIAACLAAAAAEINAAGAGRIVLAQSRPLVVEQVPGPASGPLSKKNLDELIRLAHSREDGADFRINEQVAAALGLSGPMTVRQFGAQVNPGLQHFFQHLPDGSGYVFARRDTTASRLYYLNSNLAFIAASIAPAGQVQAPVRDRAKAMVEARQELEAWKRILD